MFWVFGLKNKHCGVMYTEQLILSVSSNNLRNVSVAKTELWNAPFSFPVNISYAFTFSLGLFSFSSSLICINPLSSHSSQERPKSALERLYSGDPAQQQQRGKMSADEQLERMKRHQKALVRQRKRTLSHGDRHASPSPRPSSSSSRPLSADLGSVCY